MTPDELVNLAQGIIVIVGIAAVAYSVFKNSTTRATIQSQRELIETLTAQVNELRTLHQENEKAIAKLSGALEVYKEIPLKDIASSLKLLHNDHKELLKK